MKIEKRIRKKGKRTFNFDDMIISSTTCASKKIFFLNAYKSHYFIHKSKQLSIFFSSKAETYNSGIFYYIWYFCSTKYFEIFLPFLIYSYCHNKGIFCSSSSSLINLLCDSEKFNCCVGELRSRIFSSHILFATMLCYAKMCLCSHQQCMKYCQTIRSNE